MLETTGDYIRVKTDTGARAVVDADGRVYVAPPSGLVRETLFSAMFDGVSDLVVMDGAHYYPSDWWERHHANDPVVLEAFRGFVARIRAGNIEERERG